MFEPKHLLDILTRHSLPHQYKKGTAVVAEGQQESEELLRAAFSDTMDFLFVPTPKPFVTLCRSRRIHALLCGGAGSNGSTEFRTRC